MEKKNKVVVIKNTQNSCCRCMANCGSWIYCPIFNQLIGDGNDFDETGEKDGCNFFKDSQGTLQTETDPEEDVRIMSLVGNYSMAQASHEDCLRCHKAKFGTVIINGLCLDCFETKILEKETIKAIIKMAIPSLSPDGYNHLELALDELITNRHIPINLEKVLQE